MNSTETQDISLLETLPPPWPEELLGGIKENIKSANYKIIILDDDPTGTQTARDLPILTNWSVKSISDELIREFPAFFILTNSRSITTNKAQMLAEEIGENIALASKQTGIRAIVISRSDSTLRGHFPEEVDSMAAALGKKDLPYLILPFFLEGGRFTIDDIHYVREGDNLIPAAQTQFALDKAFGFSKSNLKEWVAEKTNGRISSSEVHSISIEDIRHGGPKRVVTLLSAVPRQSACIVNFADYRDMEVLVTALLQLEKEGKEFLYRTAASFVRTRIGMEENSPLLTKQDLKHDNENGGLFVIGSYVEKTSGQLEALLTKTNVAGIEARVETLLSPDRQQEILRITDLCTACLAKGSDCAIYTSRELVTGDNASKSLDIGQAVSDSLVEIVSNIRLQPSYLVAKGGITSSDVATKALGIKRAMVIGQPQPGVPAWRLGTETRFPGMSYVIFPGNVGEIDALVHLKKMLE